VIDLRLLSTFVWVAQLKSFHRAVAKLNITQPAISQRIAQLEDELGVPLLVRDRRSVVLTDAGRSVLRYAERMLGLRNEMIAAVADPSRLRANLRLGVAETIVHTWLPRYLERMSATYPHIILDIDVDISVNLRQRLLSQQVDLAFLVGPISVAAIRNRLLNAERLAFLASPRLGLPRRRTSVAAIAEHPIITFSRNTQPYVNLSELFSDPDLAPPRIHASASVATIVKMALDGLGVAVLPPSIVRDEIKAKRLVELSCETRLPHLQFVAGWLATPDVGLVRTVVEIAAEIAGEHENGMCADARKPRA
jgi:DNA-binding transcriptional LysR family regulator